MEDTGQFKGVGGNLGSQRETSGELLCDVVWWVQYKFSTALLQYFLKLIVITLIIIVWQDEWHLLRCYTHLKIIEKITYCIWYILYDFDWFSDIFFFYLNIWEENNQKQIIACLIQISYLFHTRKRSVHFLTNPTLSEILWWFGVNQGLVVSSSKLAKEIMHRCHQSVTN